MPSNRRGKGKASVKSESVGAATSRRSARSRAAEYNGVPDVFASMLDDADATEHELNDRPLKRRRFAAPVTSSKTLPSHSARPGAVSSSFLKPQPKRQELQTVEDSSESEGSELNFEDVDLDNGIEPSSDAAAGIDDLTISVEPESVSKRSAQNRRKPVTTVEKAHRLLVHKLHILCLLGHCMFVNGRCNNATAQRHLRTLLSSKTLSYLKPMSSNSQFQRNRSFIDGLQQAVGTFTGEYRVTAGGMIRPHWTTDGSEPQLELSHIAPVDRSDFVEAAKSLEGSQDLANQLFCCMLRAAGVEARVVCSLQVLPFASVPKGSTPKKQVKTRIMAIASDTGLTKQNTGSEDTAITSSKSIGNVPSVRRRLGQPAFVSEPPKTPTPKNKTKKIPKLQYPVFWTEAFNAAQQKWVAVDAIVTNTVDKPTKIEPPASYEMNQLIYAVAFENDGTARDVTRRYAKAYNAKTRRHRVEASMDGAKWWKKALGVFRRRGGALDREQVEDSELAQKEGREGMPGNILDFKDHPYYALERHLKRHEVLNPRREVGKVNAGTAGKPRMEPVFRRQDVVLCKSADKWYRVGRVTKAGEQPLKYVPTRTVRQRSVEDMESQGTAKATGLYAAGQTEQYVSAPVQRGRVPRNRFGNLDIYVPSMVPAGGRHIRHPLTKQAARVLKVDSADAVTGFSFKGRQGTAIIEGAVVPSQYADAVEAIIDGLEYEALEEQSKARSLLALKLWKRFLTGLSITERVRGYGDGKEAEAEDEGESEAAFTVTVPLLPEVDDAPLLTAGKFYMEELSAASKRAKPRKRKAAVESESEEELEPSPTDEDDDLYPEGLQDAGGFSPDPDSYRTDYQHGGGFMPASDAENESLLTGDDHEEGDDGGGGGFFAPVEPADDLDCEAKFDHGMDEDDDGGGGFLQDDEAQGFDGAGGFIQGREDGADADDLLGDGERAETEQNERLGGFISATEEEITEHSEAMQDGEAEFGKHDIATAGNAEQAYVHEDEPATDTVEASATEHASDDSMPLEDPEDDEAEPDWLE